MAIKKGPSRAVPPALDAAIAAIKKQTDGRYCYGLPNYQLDAKLKLKLVTPGDLTLFARNEVDVEEHAAWVPFASLKDEPQFLVIQVEPPYAVGMWEHEDGKLHDVWSSLDEFTARVIDKKTKTPFQLFGETLEEVAKLIEQDAHAKALELIEPGMRALPEVASRSFEDGGLARAHNLHGLALKGVERWPEARAAFTRAVEAGDTYAELNILDLLEDEHDPRGVLDHGLAARERCYFDDYGRVWLARYLAFAHLDLGEVDAAEVELRKVIADYAVASADKVTKVREGLEEYVAADRPGAAAARGFLTWFKPKTYEVTADDAARNRGWWDRLPAEMRAKLLEEIEHQAAAAPVGDETIARCLDVDSLNLRKADGTFDTLDVFLPLRELTRLSFYGDPDTLEPLRALPKLVRLTINNEVIKDLVYPSRADRDLWHAAAEADRVAIERALAAGASLSSRGDHGSPALAMVARKHDIELCEWLVAQGADPWAGSHGDMSTLSFFGPDEVKRLEAAAAAAGITHPDLEPWRTLSVARQPRGATFDDPEVELAHDLDDGEPTAQLWPADVTVVMEPPKKDNKLFDLCPVGYRSAMASERLADLLRDEPNLELLPVTVVDHAGKRRPERYFILNPLRLDCLVVERCYPRWNHIDPDSISELSAMVFDTAKIGAANIFRPGVMNSRPTIVSRALADKLAPFTGVGIGRVKR